MNENVIKTLNQYMENPDPQYAVLIKGLWGCGKTFLVKNWIQDLNKRPSSDNVLQPIYVSLYGLKTTQEITTAINMVLYPRLYGKVAKVGKSLWKIVSGIVLHHEIDFVGCFMGGLKLDFPLDALFILNSEENIIKNDKFLIFDDIERCQVPIKELLGYINYFVEHCRCHVIIIGDDTKIKGDEKSAIDEFKEKTIGREITLKPNVDCAIGAFVESLGDFVKNHVVQIRKVFDMTGCENLRILRQSLWDFNQVEIHLKPEDKKTIRRRYVFYTLQFCGSVL